MISAKQVDEEAGTVFRRRLSGYRAAFRVAKHRQAAEQLRRQQPDLYQQILNSARGEAAEAAANDPDAYVALFLAAAEDQEVTRSD
jgi:hypothetical protein